MIFTGLYFGVFGTNVLSVCILGVLKTFLSSALWDLLELIIILEFGSCSFSGLH